MSTAALILGYAWKIAVVVIPFLQKNYGGKQSKSCRGQLLNGLRDLAWAAVEGSKELRGLTPQEAERAALGRLQALLAEDGHPPMDRAEIRGNATWFAERSTADKRTRRNPERRAVVK